jgi:hypothetical protein
LTWYARRILLVPECASDGSVVVREMKFTQGSALDSSVLDPAKHYTFDKDRKKPPRPLVYREERTLWRDSAVLFSLRATGYRPPIAFHWLAELAYEERLNICETRRYLALGMATKPGQAKTDFYRAERMPLPLRYLEDDTLVGRLGDALKMTEDTRNQLWGAACTLATLLLNSQADAEGAHKPAPDDLNRLADQWAIERDYWSRLEIPFRQLLEALPDDVEGVLTGWRTTLRNTAWTAFERVARDLEHDPRNLKSTVRARDQLAAGLGKALPKS